MYGGGPRFILPAVPFRIGSGDAYRAVFRPRFPFFAVQQPSSPGRRGAYVLESTARSTVRAEAPRRFDPTGPESSAVPKRCLRGRAVSGKGHRRGGRSEPSVLPPEREANCTYRCERSPIRVFLTAGSRQMQARVGTSSFVNCARPGAPVTATRTPDMGAAPERFGPASRPSRENGCSYGSSTRHSYGKLLTTALPIPWPFREAGIPPRRNSCLRN